MSEDLIAACSLRCLVVNNRGMICGRLAIGAVGLHSYCALHDPSLVAARAQQAAQGRAAYEAKHQRKWGDKAWGATEHAILRGSYGVGRSSGLAKPLKKGWK